ncbi:AAA family ATPase [Microbacterium sp.]|uniref:AAA family ATPase n=1 Tax=Microbacterium sp. TaxID=51671 RepID=UPI0035673343
MISTEPFQLLRVEVEDEEGVNVEVELAPRATGGSWTTLLTGRNGSGKSRLLSAVAGAFDALNGRHLRGRDPIAVEYVLGQSECAFRVDRGRSSAYLDGRRVEPSALPKPSIVAAATASAFDKFHLPREDRSFRKGPSPSQYRYLGLKDARGRISGRAGVFRALEQLFDASTDTQGRRGRVADVFRYLGYRPAVEVSYAWTYRGKGLIDDDGTVAPGAVEQYLKEEKERASNTSRNSIPKYFLDEAEFGNELAASMKTLSELNVEQEGRLIADFTRPHATSEDHLQMARRLSRAGLAQMDEVTLWRERSSRRIEITEASSGELSLAVTMLGLASAIEDHSLILIDEPEISLHPQWQAEYLGRLQEAFAAYQDCHFIIATHSPTLTAGAGNERTSIVNLEGPVGVHDEPSSGRSVDEVLVRTFGVVSKDSLYLRELLVNALRGAEEGDLASPKHDEEMAALQAARPHLLENDSAGELIDRLIRIRSRLAERRDA